MKKGFRRILTALLCLTLLLSAAAVSLTASAAGGSMAATVWEDFSGYEVGTKVKPGTTICLYISKQQPVEESSEPSEESSGGFWF